jgi:hypothetical protein
MAGERTRHSRADKARHSGNEHRIARIVDTDFPSHAALL